jgi:hypothetical protein
MGVAKAYGRYHLLDHFEKILFGPFADFPCRQGGGGVRNKERTEAFLHLCSPDQRLDAIGEIDNLFEMTSADLERFRHALMDPSVTIIDNHDGRKKGRSSGMIRERPGTFPAGLQKMSGNFDDEGIQSVAAEIRGPNKILTRHIQDCPWGPCHSPCLPQGHRDRSLPARPPVE